MSKKIIKSFILFIILILLCTSSFATDAVTTTGIDAVDNNIVSDENSAGTTETIESVQDISYGDMYKCEDKITINGKIDGNLFLLGKEVIIEDSALIGGDVFICASTINIGKAVIYGNIFACAKDITLNAETYDLYAACENLSIEYYALFHRDVKAAVTKTAKINGVILKNANISCDDIKIESDCLIYENLNYESKTELTGIPEGTVQGTVNYTKAEIAGKSMSSFIFTYAISFLSILAYSLLVWFLMKKVTPKFINKVSNLKISQIAIALGLGIATLIVIPIISVLLLFSYVGVFIGLALLAIYFLVISISLVTFVIAISSLVKSKIQKGKEIVYILLGTTLMFVLTNIPYVGWVFAILELLIGLGIFTLSFFIKAKEE